MKTLRRMLLRMRFRRALLKGDRISIKDAARLWRLSDMVFIGPVGASATVHPECELYRHLAEDNEISDDEISQYLRDSSGTVAAYALELLIRRRSGQAKDARDALSERTESVSLGLGCMFSYQPLCEFAVNRLNAEQVSGGNGGQAR